MRERSAGTETKEKKAEKLGVLLRLDRIKGVIESSMNNKEGEKCYCLDNSARLPWLLS